MSSALRSDVNLPDALVARARAASDGRLALDVVCGLFVALAVAAWHPRMWLIPFSAAICFAAYGGWGITLRERSDVAGALVIMTLRVVRSLAVAAGVIAAATALFALLAIVLGNWIS